jgi:uncharacterized protein YndB with AHSA1/START domain
MTVTNIQKDVETFTLTVTARFDASPSRLWQIWADPRQLERWWGPPTFPATFVAHDLRDGGKSTYYMTGPEGDEYHGWWNILVVEPDCMLKFEDGFSTDTGEVVPDLPVTIATMTLAAISENQTEMICVSEFSSLEAMEELVEMGMIEGFVLALSQVPQVLTAGTFQSQEKLPSASDGTK